MKSPTAISKTCGYILYGRTMLAL